MRLKFMKSKKAQITLFIILGIAVLLMASVSYYIYSQKAESLQIAEIAEDTTALPELKILVENCMGQIGTEAIKKIGQQGGYISLDDPKYSGGKSFELNSRPTESDVVEFIPGSDHLIPYWWYLVGEDVCRGNCRVTSSNIPSLEEIQLQLNEYIKENLMACLDNLNPIRRQGFQVTPGKITPSVEFTEDDVVFFLNFPVTLEKPGVKHQESNFRFVLDVQFRDMYTLAASIAMSQKYFQLFEKNLMHMISIHSGVDFNKLPPISATTHDDSIVFWQTGMVKRDIQAILLSYISLIRINGTKNGHSLTASDPNIAGFYDSMLFNLGFTNPSFKDINANVYYLNWPIFVDITPDQNTRLQPSTEVTEFMGGFVADYYINNYQFFYDVSYPLVIELREPGAFNDQGYSFLFAIEVNVRDNKDLFQWNQGAGTFGPVDFSQVKVQTTLQNTEHGECTSKEGKWHCSINGLLYPTQILCTDRCILKSTNTLTSSLDPILFCRADQQLSGLINISTKNKKDGSPLNGVIVRYKCGTYASCQKGLTEFYNSTDAGYSGKFPVCLGGFLELKKKNFQTKVIPLDIDVGTAEALEVEMDPFRYFDMEFKKIRLLTPIPFEHFKGGEMQKDWPVLNIINQTPITIHEKISISIEKVPETPYEPRLINSFMYDGNNSQILPPIQLKLIPGSYKVSAQLIDSKGIHIEKGCQGACMYILEQPFPPVKSCTGYKKLPKKDIDMETALLGGLELNNGFGNSFWNITPADLDDGAEAILFKLIKVATPTCLDTIPVHVDQKGGYEMDMMEALEVACLDTSTKICVGLEEMGKTEVYMILDRLLFEPEFLYSSE